MYTISLSFPAKLKRRTIKNPTTTKKANLHIYRWKKRTKPRNTMSSRAVVYAKPQQEEKKKYTVKISLRNLVLLISIKVVILD